MTRRAISPRLAIKILLNMPGDLAVLKRWRSGMRQGRRAVERLPLYHARIGPTTPHAAGECHFKGLARLLHAGRAELWHVARPLDMNGAAIAPSDR